MDHRDDVISDGTARSPLEDEHALLGACLETADGYAYVASYGEPAEESACLLDPAKTFLCDLSLSGKFRIAGQAAVNFICGMFSCDFTQLASVGHGTVAEPNRDTLEGYAHARSIAPLSFELIRSGDDEYMLLTPSCSKSAVYRWLSDFADTGDDTSSSLLSLSDESDALAHLLSGGGRAAAIVSDLMSTSGDDNAAVADTFQTAGTLSYAKLDGIPALVYSTTAFTARDRVGGSGGRGGEVAPAFELLCPLRYARMLWRNLLSFLEVEPIGLRALDGIACMAASTGFQTEA